MKKPLILISLFFITLTQHSHACSQISPESAFIISNDPNQDGKLSPKEWQNAQIDRYFVAFRLGNLRDFKRLDKNKNGFLSHRELANKVRYERDPCADWEEAMQKMSEQSQNQQ